MNILKDHTHKSFQILEFLRPDLAMLITDNVIVMKKYGYTVSIEDFTDGMAEEWKQQGYTEDTGLYDQLVLEFNGKNPLKHLRR